MYPSFGADGHAYKQYATVARGGFRGGGEGAATPFRQVITQKKATFCCSQTVKSNILLSQNAGNAISETLDVHNFPGGYPGPL